MIYAAVKPIEEYDCFVSQAGKKYGLVDSYGHWPALLALIMIASPLPYDFEGDKPILQRRVKLGDDQPYIDSLSFEIGGVPMSTWLESINPLEFSTLLRSTDISKMPIVKVYVGSSTLCSLVGARSAAWAKAYRGRVSTTGKVIQAAFGGSKPMFNIPSGDIIMNEFLTKEYSYGKV